MGFGGFIRQLRTDPEFWLETKANILANVVSEVLTRGGERILKEFESLLRQNGGAQVFMERIVQSGTELIKKKDKLADQVREFVRLLILMPLEDINNILRRCEEAQERNEGASFAHIIARQLAKEESESQRREILKGLNNLSDNHFWKTFELMGDSSRISSAEDFLHSVLEAIINKTGKVGEILDEAFKEARKWSSNLPGAKTGGRPSLRSWQGLMGRKATAKTL